MAGKPKVYAGFEQMFEKKPKAGKNNC